MRTAISPRFATRSFRIGIVADRMRRRYPGPLDAAAARPAHVRAALCLPGAGERRHALPDRRPRLGARRRDEPVRRARLRRGGLGLPADPRRTTTAARRCSSSRPGTVRVLLAEGQGGGEDRLVEAVQGRRRARQGAEAEAGHAERSSPRSSRSCARRSASSPVRAPLRLGADAYRGALLVHKRGGRLTVVNRLPLDRYLRGVVPWEMPDDWHPEALRAQAVVARSYALATLKPGTLFDLYADTRSQVYGGVQAEEDSTNRAIGSTAGRVVFWNGPGRDDLLPLDLGRPDGLDRGSVAERGAGAVPRLRRRPVRHALEASPLGAVPADARAGRARGSVSRGSATSSSRAGRRDA